MLAGDCRDQLLPLPPKILQIKQDDNKFSSKISSKDQNPKAESSFRVLYYGKASGAVPFTWETRPGTPKHNLFQENSLPPLTPPPSYLFSPKMKMNSSGKKNLKPKIDFKSILARFSFKGGAHEASGSLSSSSYSSSSVSSSFSLPSTPKNLYNGRRRNGDRRSKSLAHFGVYEDEDEIPASSPDSTLCFGGRRSRSAGAGKFSMYRPMRNVKRALSFVVGGNGMH